MRKFTLLVIIIIVSTVSQAQEWDDPISTSDWNQLWKSSFIQSLSASNAPESYGWFWGINMNHSSNNSNYRYNGQIAIKNATTTPTMYFRSTNSNGDGIWANVISSYYNSALSGNLTTTNSLRIMGNNLSGSSLSFLQNSGALLVGWNRSGGHGETSFISNRAAGSRGGFEFRDLSNSGAESLLLKMSGDGNIGIGTSNPNSILHIEETAPVITFKATNLGSGVRFNTIDQNGDLFRFQKDNVTQMIIKNSGSVGIGTTNTGTHKLAVEGSIGARKIKVEATGWSDFVFESDYQLHTLEEVEKYISKNKHLSEIPSEKEVIQNGIDLGQMDAKLLQKIEEITLYLIEQNKQNQTQQARIEQLEKELKALKKK